MHVPDMPREHYKEELAQHQEGVLISFSERASTCCGMTTMAAVKRLRSRTSPEHHRAEPAWSVLNGECYDEVLFHGLEDYINNCRVMA